MKNEKWWIQLPSATVRLAFAPAERDVYRTRHRRKILLAPAERNIRLSPGQRGNIALRWSANYRVESLIYKHSPRWGEEADNVLLHFEVESTNGK
ncbi:MAG TPA: hypothetical protein DC047_03960 [Blastocatellia bacterium]|nr:hypothetical protein [Blastocatellia bacterium]